MGLRLASEGTGGYQLARSHLGEIGLLESLDFVLRGAWASVVQPGHPGTSLEAAISPCAAHSLFPAERRGLAAARAAPRLARGWPLGSDRILLSPPHLLTWRRRPRRPWRQQSRQGRLRPPPPTHPSRRHPSRRVRCGLRCLTCLRMAYTCGVMHGYHGTGFSTLEPRRGETQFLHADCCPCTRDHLPQAGRPGRYAHCVCLCQPLAPGRAALVELLPSRGAQNGRIGWVLAAFNQGTNEITRSTSTGCRRTIEG